MDAACSPVGLSRNKESLIAVLTADHRVGIYGPTKDPERDSWILRHALLLDALSSKGFKEGADVDTITQIRQLRITAIAWTPPVLRPGYMRGQTFLVTGNEAGELQFHDITEATQKIVHLFKCADRAITRILSCPLSSDGWLYVVISDVYGTIRLISIELTVGDHGTQLSGEFQTLDLLSNAKVQCTNMQLHFAGDDSLLIAVTYPGRLFVLEYHLRSRHSKKVVVELPFFCTVSGLCWAGASSTGFTLFVFGLCGQVIVLVLDRMTFTLQKDLDKMQLVEEHLQDALVDPNLVGDTQSGGWEIRIHGAALSPETLFLALSYTKLPKNSIQYLISATSLSTIATICIDKETKECLEQLISNFVHNPFTISSSHICGLCKKVGLSVLESILPFKDAPSTSVRSGISLTERLFCSQSENLDRIAMASGELHAGEAESTAARLRKVLFMELLRFGSTSAHFGGADGLAALLRIADYVVLHRNADAGLVDLARALYLKLQDLGHPLEDVIVSFLEDGTISSERWPSRDSCPACSSPVPMEDTPLTAKCTQGHIWSRCSLTLALLGSPICRSCFNCGRKAVADSTPGDEIHAEILDACQLCFYCGGNWYSKI